MVMMSCVCLCVQVAKLADIVYRTRKADLQLQVIAGSAGFLYPALTVGLYTHGRFHSCAKNGIVCRLGKSIAHTDAAAGASDDSGRF